MADPAPPEGTPPNPIQVSAIPGTSVPAPGTPGDAKAPTPNLPPAVPVTAAERAAEERRISFWAALLFGHTKHGELAVYSHSHLFYWWPIWFFGFIMAFITYWGDTHLAFVPAHSVAAQHRQVEVEVEGKLELQTRDVIILPAKTPHFVRKDADGNPVVQQPTIYISRTKGVGSMFVLLLLLVIIITNVPMRGLWSLLITITLIMVSIIFYVAGYWEVIFARLGQMSIHINLGGYLLISLVLFIFWLVNYFWFDRQIYMIFTPGQVRMRLEIGGGETVYDTVGMVVQKQRSDIFRHWFLGFGSGDLIIHPKGLTNPINLHNVLRVGQKVRIIEEMVKEKVIITSAPK